MKKWMKELQQVDFKLAAWNKLCLYDVEIFLQNLDFFPLYSNYIMFRDFAFHTISWLKIRLIGFLIIGDIIYALYAYIYAYT